MRYRPRRVESVDELVAAETLARAQRERAVWMRNKNPIGTVPREEVLFRRK